jgi:hypothetical protein
MARVAIDSRHLNELPNLCVKTGEPTGTTGRQDFADIPGWTLLLIFWGVLPFLIAAGLARRKITVELPASEETLRHIRRVELAAVAGLVVGVGLLIAAVVSPESGFAWSGIAVVLITLLAATGGRNVVWVTGRLDDEILWLYRVHPRFAEQAQILALPDLASRMSARRWTTGLLVVALVALGVLISLAVWIRV